MITRQKKLEMQFLDGDDILITQFGTDVTTVLYLHSCLLEKIQVNISHSDFRKDGRSYCCQFPSLVSFCNYFFL